MGSDPGEPPPRPVGLLAELTHRCPLGCPYCSNPLALVGRPDELDTAAWVLVMQQAAALGVLQVHLSGGEPAARSDLAEITAAAAGAGLYTNLITSGVGLPYQRLRQLADAGLDHVQVSLQDSIPGQADRVAGHAGAYERKRRAAAAVVETGLPLTINIVIHRDNIDRIPEMVEAAASLGAIRVEIAHVQYHGWALKNRGALMPGREQVIRSLSVVEELRRQYRGRLVIDAVSPDYFARFPKPCMGGWGRRLLNVTPSGRVLPCHAAESIPGLEFWSVRDRSLSEIWERSPAFAAFRGTGWMQSLCGGCPRREQDFGGCRCQAFALVGDARAADPVCHLSPAHELLQALTTGPERTGYVYRRMR